MIVSKLIGGLGNQMFQYSIGRYLSLKYNTSLKLDIKELLYRPKILRTDFVYRDYDLDIFNLNLEIGNFSNNNIIYESYFHFNPSVLSILDNHIESDIYLDGYWQSYKYFEQIFDIIKTDFIFKNKISGESEKLLYKIKESDSIMINIRRTDYLNTNYHGVIGVDYVMKAIDIIKSQIKNPQYFIFSNDIEWCRKNIKLNNMTIVDNLHNGPKFSTYFQLMINCKHFIIPNSTFAWWSAWLSNNTNKIIIAPIKWFTNQSINTNDLIPDNWIRI